MGKDKAKTKEKEKDKGKEKEKADELPLVYNHIDGSVHDSAVSAYLGRGYEMFKVSPVLERHS